jgi:hypothetical protein
MVPSTLRSRPNRRWILFFLVLSLLGATAVVLPLAYNLSILLRPEQLADARRKWQEKGLSDYDLAYLYHLEHEGEETKDQYLVRVRGGRVVSATVNNEVLAIDRSLAVVAGPGLLAGSFDDPRRYGVPAMFDEMEAALRQDAAAGQRNFATATFDPRDGHPLRYVHRIRGTRDRLEWTIKLTRVNGSDPSRAAE